MKNKFLQQILMLTKLAIYGIFFQCLFISMLMAADSKAQDIKSVREVRIKLEAKVYPIKEIFDNIEASTNFHFSYYPGEIDTNQKVLISGKTRRVSDVLLQISKEADLSFRQINNSINVRKKPGNTSVKPIEVIIQGITITGKVTTSEDGSGLPGVNVMVKGTSIGTVTDVNGNYTIEVPDESATLVFSSVGYVTEELAVGNRSVIDITLAPDITALQEIVVIGYGSVEKKDLTGAVVSLDRDNMTTGAAASSISSMLQGRAAGVEVSANDGAPGQALNILVRGATSISNSNQPLYVVDGFPISGGVSIAPEDIENIVVLKDAASAAIYGSRASGGVVLITTKKGSADRTEVSYEGYAGVQQLIGKLDYLDWTEHTKIVNEQYAQGPNDGNPWYNSADIALPNNTDWVDEVTRGAMIQNHTIRASGGSNRSRYSLSANQFIQDGIFLNTGFKRTSLRLNTEQKFGERTNVGANIYVSRIHSVAMDRRPGSRINSPWYATLHAARGRAAYNPDGTLGSTPLSRDERPFINPIGLYTERDSDYREWRTYSNLFIDHKINDYLSAKINLGFDHTSGNDGDYRPPPYTAADYAVGNITEVKSTTYLMEGTLNYNREFNNNHTLNVLAGVAYQYSDYFTFSASGNTFPTDKTSYYNLGSATNMFISSYREDNKILSYFARIMYSIKDKYIFTTSMRGDGASQFGEQRKWGIFPTGSVAWRINEEDFLSESSLISDLKVRVSYGLTGNNAIPAYRSLSRVATTINYTYDGMASSAGLGPDGFYAPNPFLQWETTAMLNIGLDFGLWDNRLYGSVEVYNSDTRELIIDKPLAASSGYMFILENVGSSNNKGIELTLGAHLVTSENFKWTIDGNFSANRNEITGLAGDVPVVLQVARQPYGEVQKAAYRQLEVGSSIGEFYGYVFNGLLQSGETYAPQPNTTVPGSALYKDINEDGIIDGNDRTVIGNAFPDYIWGINNHFEFKGLYLDMFWQGVVGNDIFNFKAVSLDRFQTTMARERYSPTNTTGSRPGVDWFAGEYGSYINTVFIEDGTYARLKNLVLGYTINTGNLTWLNSVNIYVQGQNLLTFTKYTGFDPEVSFNYRGSQSSVNRGVDDYGYPNSKTYTVGLKLVF